MPFQPFQAELANHRCVVLPAEMDEAAREKLINKIAGAVRQQAEMAQRSVGMLRITGEIIREADRVLIPHEPASPLDPARIDEPDEHPDIRTVWWLSWATIDALKAAAEQGAPHGGIQPGALYLDEAGRVKLGDFGIAPAFESVCGIDVRRQLHCDASVQAESSTVRLSGVWALREEDENLDYGWIAPFFAHELLEGKLRLNPKSDQFALGTLLFLIATGKHAYGAALSDPSLMFYFTLEPYEVADERRDWAEAFERLKNGLSTSDDQPILAWSDFVKTLLASDSGSRFAKPDDALAAAADCVAPAWAEACAAIADASAALDAGDSEAFLAAARPWVEREDLPALWRERLAQWVAVVESQKEVIGKLKQLQQKLEAANDALDGLDLNTARQSACEVLEAPEADEAMRSAAQTLLEQCDEQEQFVQSGADAMAQAYLDSARECIAQGTLDQARQLIDGVLADTGTPKTRLAQARELLAQLEAIEQRSEHQAAELIGATEDIREGRYDAARQRLDVLLGEEDLGEAVAEQARLLLDEIADAQRKRAAYADALEQARAAWERADADAMAEHLGAVPESFDDREIADIRADLSERLDALRDALRRKAAIEAQLDQDAVAALQTGEKTRELPELPQLLRDELDSLIEKARARVEQQRRAAIEKAQAALAQAATELEQAKPDACRRLIQESVLTEPGLPDQDRQQAEQLLTTATRCEQADAELREVEALLADKQLDQAIDKLDAADCDGLPAAIYTRRDALLEQVAAAREALAEKKRAELAALLDQVPDQINAGKLDEADRVLVDVERSCYLTDALRQRAEPLRQQLDELRPILSAIQEVERLVAHDDVNLQTAGAAVERLPGELPQWAATRVEQLRGRLAELTEQRRQRAVADANAQLDAAEAALDDGQLDAARTALDEAASAIELDEQLAARHASLGEQIEQLAAWLPRVAAVEQALAGGDIPAAHRQAGELSAEAKLPERLRPRVAQVLKQTKQRITDRRAEIDGELAALDGELKQRGRRARRFAERSEGIRGDALATKAQREKAAELLAAYDQLPPPTTPRWPLMIGGGVGLIAVIGAGLYFAGVFNPPTPTPNPTPIAHKTPAQNPQPPNGGQEPPPVAAADVISQRLAALRADFEQLAQQASADGREPIDWSLGFDPPDAFPTALVATAAGRAPVILGRAADEDALTSLAINPDVIDTLWPAPPPGPTLAQRMGAALARLRAELANARAAAKGEKPEYTLRFEPPDALPADLIARDTGTGQEQTLVRVDDTQLDQLRLSSAMRQTLYPPPQMPTLAEATTALIDDLRHALPDTVTDIAAAPAGDNAIRISASAGGVALQPFGPIAFDPDTGRFTTDAGAVAAYLKLQADALARLARGVRISGIDNAYDDRIEIADDQRPEILAVDAASQLVTLRTRGRINGDPRADASFALSGQLSGQQLAADDATRRGFTAYLTDLRRAQWPASRQAIAAALKLPPGLTLEATSEIDGGPAVTLAVRGPGGAGAAEIGANWNAANLNYAIDTAAAREAIATAMRQLAASPQTQDAVRAAWPAVRDALAADAQMPGRALVQAAELRSVEISAPTADDPFTASATVRFAPPNAPQDVELSTAVPLRFGADGFRPDLADAAGLRAQVSTQLAKLGNDPAWRQARQQQAVAALASELGIDAGDIDTTISGDMLTANVGGETPGEYIWRWNATTLDWTDRTKRAASPPAAATLDNRLDQLAAQGNVTPQALAAALADVTREKAQRMGATNYQPLASLSGAGGLEDVSRQLQRLVAPDSSQQRYPNVFIEYFVGQQSVYGLSWQVQTNARGQISGIQQPTVWKVMPTADLQRYAQPADFRRAYASNAAIGESLLGPALGPQISGSGNGNFGLMIAPDGPLWLVRWEQVRFNARPVRGVHDNGAQVPGTLTRLHDLLRGTQPRPRDWKFAQAGVWCVPSLGGQWRGRRTFTLSLGKLIAGQPEVEVSFRPRGRERLLLGWVRDATIKTNDFQWGAWARQVRRDNIGYSFWNYNWEGDTWKETPTVAFSLIQVP